MITRTNSIFLITITILIVGSLVQPTLSKFTLAVHDLSQQQNQSQQQIQNQTSVSADQVDQQGLASTLIEEATEYVQSGDTSKALSYLTLANEQLSPVSENEIIMLVNDATESIQSGDTSKALSLLTVANQQLSSTSETASSSGEFNPNVQNKESREVQITPPEEVHPPPSPPLAQSDNGEDINENENECSDC